MCFITLKYYLTEVQEPQKTDFEARVNMHYADVCELLKGARAYLLVYWVKPGEKLRAILISDFATEAILKANGLPDSIEYDI